MGIDDLPTEALLSIFDRLDTVEVVKTFGVVNKQFSQLIFSSDFWCSKTSGLPRCLVQRVNVIPGFYANLWHRLYRTNLINNDSWGNAANNRNWLMPQSNGWRVTLHGGHGWLCEYPPVGLEAPPCKPLPSVGAPVDAQTGEVLASSYSWCELMQPVNLLLELCRRGMERIEAEQYLDGGPELTFTVWYGARFDCEAVAEVQVVLDDGSDIMPPYTGRREFPWNRNAITDWSSGQLPAAKNRWTAASHTFKGYGPGVRRAIVLLRGKDERFWAGQYGSKFAAPELHFGPRRRKT